MRAEYQTIPASRCLRAFPAVGKSLKHQQSEIALGLDLPILQRGGPPPNSTPVEHREKEPIAEVDFPQNWDEHLDVVRAD
jgi:hypothetical protein